MHEINRNSSGVHFCEDSFVGQLHERRVWSDEEYQKLEAELIALCAESGTSATISRELATKVVRIYAFLLRTFTAHIAPQDGFEIKDLSTDDLYDRIERIELLFDGFFRGEIPSSPRKPTT